jgi:hypothetical protein
MNQFGDFGGFVKVVAALRARGLTVSACGVPMLVVGPSETEPETPFGYVPGLQAWTAHDWSKEDGNNIEILAQHSEGYEAIAIAIHRHHTARIH